MNCNNRDDCFRERSKLLFFFIINQYTLENLSWFLSFHTTRFYSNIEFIFGMYFLWNMDSYWEEKQIFNLCIIYIVFYGKRSYFKSYKVSSAELYIQDNIMSALAKIVIISPHFKKERFALNFLTPQNASKFAIFMEKDNPCSFFHFSFRATFIFHLWMPRSMLT